MSFTGTSFFLIVLSTILFYFAAPGKFRWIILLVSSCIFYYLSTGIPQFVLLLVTVGITFFAGIQIDRSEDNKRKKKLYLNSAVILVLGILTIIKLRNYVSLFSRVIVPLGVSYYTLSLISYLVDVYVKKEKPELNFFKLLLYTIYFPKIIQGPISKFRELGPKLIEAHPYSYDNLCCGVQLIIWGYFKKLVIVERTAMLTGKLFPNITDYTEGGFALLFAIFLAAVSHYCDFSSYMDIVTGISQIMGIELDKNFNLPFFSRSAAEFWRRWHITLGVWFKDYVYMPIVINPYVIRVSKWFRTHLGKRAGKAVMTIIPTAAVWLLTGLWHGTGLNYIVWGLYWGTIILISNVFEPELKKITALLRIDTEKGDWKLFQTIRTFFFFMIGFSISTLFELKDLKFVFRIITKRFFFGRPLTRVFDQWGLDIDNFIFLMIAVLILWIVERNARDGSIRTKIAGLNAVPRWLIYASALLLVFLLGVYGPGYSTAGFAYARF